MLWDWLVNVLTGLYRRLLTIPFFFGSDRASVFKILRQTKKYWRSNGPGVPKYVAPGEERAYLGNVWAVLRAQGLVRTALHARF